MSNFSFAKPNLNELNHKPSGICNHELWQMRDFTFEIELYS